MSDSFRTTIHPESVEHESLAYGTFPIGAWESDPTSLFVRLKSEWELRAAAVRLGNVNLTGAITVSGRKTTTNADYQIATADGYTLFDFSTGSASRICALPDPAANADRLVMIRKIDSGSGPLRIATRSASVTFDSSNERVSWTGHGFSVGDPVVFRAGGGLASPLVDGTIYYVHTVNSANQFTLTASPGGSQVNLTSNGTAPNTGYALAWEYWYENNSLIVHSDGSSWRRIGGTERILLAPSDREKVVDTTTITGFTAVYPKLPVGVVRVGLQMLLQMTGDGTSDGIIARVRDGGSTSTDLPGAVRSAVRYTNLASGINTENDTYCEVGLLNGRFDYSLDRLGGGSAGMDFVLCTISASYSK